MESLNNINPVPGALPVAGAVPVAGVPVAGGLPVAGVAPVAAIPAIAPVPGAAVAGAAPAAAVAVGYVAPAAVVPISPAIPAAIPATVPGAYVAPAVPAVPAVPAIPPAVPGAPVAGNRLSSIRNSIQTASTKRLNDLLVGTGAYLIKSGKYFVTTGGKYKLTTFSVLCLMGIKDAQNIAYGTHGYNGPMPGETYEFAMFQDMSVQAEARTNKNNLIALRVCLGWTEERLKQYQSTDAGTDILIGLLEGMFGMTMNENPQPTGQPCCFSNQVVVQLSKKISRVPQLDANKQPVFDAQQQAVVKEYENEYWDKKVLFSDLVQMGYNDTTLAQAFGSAELLAVAKQRETALLAM